MAQHDMNIANQGFPATRADLNNALQALVSNSSGATAPSTTFANQWWYDTTNNKMYLRNEANNAWIEVFGLDQTNNEWQLITGQISAADGDGIAFRTDDGTTRVTLDDSGNLLVGKTTASGSTAGVEARSSGYLIATRDGDPAVQIRRLTDDGDIVEFYNDSAKLGSIGIQSNGFYIDGEGGHAGVRFSAGDLVPRQNGADIDATIDLGLATSRYKDLFLSGGAYLGGTGASNLLDDYEEGLFTPELADASSGGNTGIIGVSLGRYTRIGRICHINLIAANLNTSGMTSGNTIHIRDLPFSGSNASSLSQHGSCRTDDINVGASCFGINFLVPQGANYGLFYLNNDSAGDSIATISDILNTGSDLFVTMTYEVQ